MENGDPQRLGFIDVATEDAATLLDVRVLGEVQESVFEEIVSKLTCNMTDGARVVKTFCKDPNEACQATLGTSDDLTFLHCNAHFLLRMCPSGDAALKTVEAELNLKLGRDAYPKFARFNSAENATSRFVRTACAILRPTGDQKSGCRVESLAFCEEKEVGSKLSGDRSNRFKCFFFEGAARLIQNLATVQEVL